MPCTRPFFDLTPSAADHVCITRREMAAQEHEDFLASLSPTEREALGDDATALANTLYRALHGHCDAQDISYGAIIEALFFLQARIDVELHDAEDDVAPDDCDA